MNWSLILVCVFVLMSYGCSFGGSNIPNTDSISEQELARQTLNDFFDHLNSGDYEKAVSLYGGSYETMIDQNPDIDPKNHAELLKTACMQNGYQCLSVKKSHFARQVSSTKFIFLVQFELPDGSLFDLGPCCGAIETEQPRQSQFSYLVTRNTENQYQVGQMPPYVP